MQGKHRKKFKMRQANITKLRKYAKKQNKSKNAFLIQELTRLAKYLQETNLFFTRDSALGNHSSDSKDFGTTADHKSSSAPKSLESTTSTTANLRIFKH